MVAIFEYIDRYSRAYIVKYIQHAGVLYCKFVSYTQVIVADSCILSLLKFIFGYKLTVLFSRN